MERTQERNSGMLSRRRTVALLHGSYFAITGFWPMLSISTFEAVTGPKTDKWLVKTVGALVGVLGGVLAASAAKEEPSEDLAQVAVGSAAALAAVDVVYVAKKRISPVYLLDAVTEAALIGAWVASTYRRKNRIGLKNESKPIPRPARQNAGNHPSQAERDFRPAYGR